MQQIVIYWYSILSQHVSGIFMPIIRRSNCVPLPIVVCPVVAVVMLGSRVARCVQCVENVACYATATTGQTTIGSGTQMDLLMMGIKMPETC